MENGGELSPKTSTDKTQNDEHRIIGKPRSTSTSSGHKRSVSESLLSKLSFLRMNQTPSFLSSSQDIGIAGNLNDNDDGDKRKSTITTGSGSSSNDDNMNTGLGGSRGGGIGSGGGRGMATALQNQQRRMRRRRGSLRKTALLLEAREKRSTIGASTARDQNGYERTENVNSRGRLSPLSIGSINMTTSTTATLADEELTPRGNIDHNGSRSDKSSYSANWSRSLKIDRLLTISVDPSKAPTSIGLVGNTTDEEVNLYNNNINNNNNHSNNNNTTGGTTTTHLRPPSTSSSSSGIPLPLITTPSSSSESYFIPSHHQTEASVATTADTSLNRQLSRSKRGTSAHRTPSPLVVAPPNIDMAANHHVGVGVGVEITGGWDYSETEWWGWIILIVTWFVFVVGIGSSFGVWSWAWDVGETPYAPPELEDDPTLPIVGYYPALMVLTAVMAWVWVVVAWVGMKYFKHANISADDG